MVGLARLAQVVGDQRRAGQLGLHLGALVVEHPQRVDLDPRRGWPRRGRARAGSPAARPGRPGGTRWQPSELSSSRTPRQAERRRSRRTARTISSASSAGSSEPSASAPTCVELPVAARLGALVAEDRRRSTRASPAAAPLCRPCSSDGAQHADAVPSGRSVSERPPGRRRCTSPWSRRRSTRRRRGRTARCPRRPASRCSRSRPGAPARRAPRGRRGPLASAAGASRRCPWAPGKLI